MSLPTYLLSSMTLCFTRQLGMILLERYSMILVSVTRVSMDESICSVRVSNTLSILRDTSYSSTLSSSFILLRVSTRHSQIPFSMSHTHIRQQISNSQSLSGSSETSSWRNSMQEMLMSSLGWLMRRRMAPKTLDWMMKGMCSWPTTCIDWRMLSISSSDWQKRMGSVGYFILRLMFCSQSQLSWRVQPSS